MLSLVTRGDSQSLFHHLTQERLARCGGARAELAYLLGWESETRFGEAAL